MGTESIADRSTTRRADMAQEVQTGNVQSIVGRRAGERKGERKIEIKEAKNGWIVLTWDGYDRKHYVASTLDQILTIVGDFLS